MEQTRPIVHERASIEALLARYAAAIRAKETGALIGSYAEDAVAYDLAPPLALGPERLHDRDELQAWFDTWRGQVGFETRELTIRAGADVAFAFGLQHMSGTKINGQLVDLWFRATLCMRRQDGAWRIAHVHNSVPFAMDGSERALLDLHPE